MVDVVVVRLVFCVAQSLQVVGVLICTHSSPGLSKPSLQVQLVAARSAHSLAVAERSHGLLGKILVMQEPVTRLGVTLNAIRQI